MNHIRRRWFISKFLSTNTLENVVLTQQRRLTASMCPMRLGRIFRFCSWSVGVHGFGAGPESCLAAVLVAAFVAVLVAMPLCRRCRCMDGWTLTAVLGSSLGVQSVMSGC